jgi:16S rRNA processing protein RimM
VWVTAGYVARAHGVHGAMRAMLGDAAAHSGDDAGREAWYATWKQVRLIDRAGRQQVCTLTTCRPIHGAILFTCAEIVGREAAQLWAGASLQIAAACVPAADAGEAYVYELSGARVVDTQGAALGTVQEVLDNAGQPLLVIISPDGVERLLPLVPETLKQVDRDARSLTVRVPAGLWDDT